jgi:hypothetical protein
MEKGDSIEMKLSNMAKEISKEYDGAPVVIIVGGTGKKGLTRCMTGFSHYGKSRLRDLLGILQTSIQIETLKHFHVHTDK